MTMLLFSINNKNLILYVIYKYKNSKNKVTPIVCFYVFDVWLFFKIKILLVEQYKVYLYLVLLLFLIATLYNYNNLLMSNQTHKLNTHFITIQCFWCIE